MNIIRGVNLDATAGKCKYLPSIEISRTSAMYKNEPDTYMIWKNFCLIYQASKVYPQFKEGAHDHAWLGCSNWCGFL